jgi:phosphatidylinositol alpha-1,6-mannosyltransferase
MLLTDGFGGFGGIAKFNRDFLEALDACRYVERVTVLPRLIPEPIADPIPECVVYDRKATGGKSAFVRRALTHLTLDDRVDLVICGHIHLLPAAWTLARLRKAPLALIIHGVEAWSPLSNSLVNSAARTVDSVVAVSRYSAERFTAWSRVPMTRVFVLPNCVDLDHFRPGPRDRTLVARYALESSKIILTVGRLASEERYKGFDEVIAAMPELLRRFPTLKYLIVGDGADRQRLESKARTTGVSNEVVFAGRILESEKVAHYNLADAYVMPSSGEGFGIVLIEAAACGVPIVGSRIDGSREALLEGRLGLLVDPRQPKELYDAVTKVLETSSMHQRRAAIETFDRSNFRTRVTEWVSRQSIASKGAVRLDRRVASGPMPS